MPIFTNVVSSNPAHGKVYSMQIYVIKFVSDVRHDGGFLRVYFYFLHQWNLSPRYNCNIFESDVKNYYP